MYLIKPCFCILILLTNILTLMSQTVPDHLITAYENNNNYTVDYHEAIAYYNMLSEEANISVSEYGMTDSGFPLHEIIISQDADFNPVTIKESGKVILFVNNAIHPGEPCGVDASMKLARDLLFTEEKKSLLDHCVVVIIPIYNIGGAINRGSHSRANQQGPEAYGFRGNAKNLDLNRDFIKCDSKNAQSFNQLYNKWNPDVFVDNHTSNGADYQYSMTLIATQKDKLAKPLSHFLTDRMLPDLYEKMEGYGWEMTPYVYANKTPDDGIAGFLDLPRYSSGYAAMHNALSFMPETHMLKPYKNRVESTYFFMLSMLEHIDTNFEELLALRSATVSSVSNALELPITWEMDMEKVDKLMFKGYEARYKPSAITGKDRLYYDQSAPYEKNIPFYNTFRSVLTKKKPTAYIFPQAYVDIAERLEWNGVKVERLDEDRTEVYDMTYIEDMETRDAPYEGHYLHSKVETKEVQQTWKYYKGDYIVYTGQEKDRYIIETLEPEAPDSYFAWNFFDGIMMQKEHFSAYVFEDLAEEILSQNAALKTMLDNKKLSDKEFAEDPQAQLNFIYKNSDHYEKTYRLYPVAKIN